MSCPDCGASKSGFVTDTVQGVQVCGSCGVVVQSNMVTEEIVYARGGGGGGGGGAPMRGGRGFNQRSFGGAVKRSTTIERIRVKMREVADMMNLSNEMVEEGLRVYQMVLLKGLDDKIQANSTVLSCACLYYVSRIRRDFNALLMLIDFSEAMMESPYAIHRVYHRISSMLKIKTEALDPSEFVTKYVIGLGIRGDDIKTVSHTAAVLIARMNRDWVSQGRRPAGVIAAALYLATRMHGFTRVRLEHITKILDISDFTVMRRLQEVAATCRTMSLAEIEETNATRAEASVVPESHKVSRKKERQLRQLLQQRNPQMSDAEIERQTQQFVSRRHQNDLQRQSKVTTDAPEKRRRRASRLKAKAKQHLKKVYAGSVVYAAMVRETGEASESDDSSVSQYTDDTVSVEVRPSMGYDVVADDCSSVSESDEGEEPELPAEMQEKIAELKKPKRQRAGMPSAGDALAPAVDPMGGSSGVDFGLLGNMSAFDTPDDAQFIHDESNMHYEAPGQTQITQFRNMVINSGLDQELIALQNEVVDDPFAVEPAESDRDAILEEIGIEAASIDDYLPPAAPTVAPPAATQRREEEEEGTFYAGEVEQNYDDVSDVSDTYYDTWIIEDEQEILTRYKMWNDECGEVYTAMRKRKRDRDARAATAAKRKPREEQHHHLMPSTLDGTWGSTEEAMADSFTALRSSNINADNAAKIITSMDELVGQYRKPGMSSVLDEALMGELDTDAGDLGFT